MKGLDLLSDVNDSEIFRLNNGERIKNLGELLSALKNMSADVFSHHVSEGRNDFASWLKYSVGDGVLADRVSGVKRQDQMFRLVHQRIGELKTEKCSASEEPKSMSAFVKEEFVDFLLGLVIGFIIGLVVKTLV